MKTAGAAFLILVACATPTGPAATGAGPRPQDSSQSFPARGTSAATRDDAGRGKPASLYARLGETPAITAVVDEFLTRVSRDERINARFFNADLPRLRRLLIEFICEATGGPCKYSGRDMKASHAGMRILDSEFDALVQDLKGALDHLKVPAREQNELLGALGPLKPDMVEAGSAGMTGIPPTSNSLSGEGHATLPRLGSGRSAAAPGRTATGTPPPDPVQDRAGAFRQASTLLEKANTARQRGNRSEGEQLFSAAELIVGAPALAAVAPLFREGAPPRVTSPLQQVDPNSVPQPAAVGNSDQDHGGTDNQQRARKPPVAWLGGKVLSAGGRASPTFAVVTLEPLGRTFARRAPKHRVMEQREREFAPHVLAVPVGSTVSFPNFDPIYHNVFSRSGVQPFDLGIYRGGQSRDLVFSKEGAVRVGCNLHSNMSAYLAVISAPHYVVADSTGRFAFKNVAPGRYRLRAWTENSSTPTLETVSIKRGENQVTVTLGVEVSGGLQTDKFGTPRGAAPGK